MTQDPRTRSLHPGATFFGRHLWVKASLCSVVAFNTTTIIPTVLITITLAKRRGILVFLPRDKKRREGFYKCISSITILCLQVGLQQDKFSVLHWLNAAMLKQAWGKDQ